MSTSTWATLADYDSRVAKLHARTRSYTPSATLSVASASADSAARSTSERAYFGLHPTRWDAVPKRNCIPLRRPGMLSAGPFNGPTRWLTTEGHAEGTANSNRVAGPHDSSYTNEFGRGSSVLDAKAEAAADRVRQDGPFVETSALARINGAPPYESMRDRAQPLGRPPFRTRLGFYWPKNEPSLAVRDTNRPPSRLAATENWHPASRNWR